MKRLKAIAGAFGLAALLATSPSLAAPDSWVREWPRTDFSRVTVPLDEIRSGGPPKDGIPAIDKPKFVDIAEVRDLSPRDPVIGVTIGGQSKAYPLRVLVWHEIVND